jgi:hypothetical protein
MAEHPHFEDEGHEIEDKVEAPKKQEPVRSEVQQFTDSDGRAVLRGSTTLEEVKEEHIYVLYKNAFWEMVLEVDLLGDQAVFRSDGRIPPVIHILCPKCARNGHRDNALSITHTSVGGTKSFEVEDLEEKDWGAIIHPQTGKPIMGSDGMPVIVQRRLTIKESFKCEYCHARYKITDNQMRDS